MSHESALIVAIRVQKLDDYYYAASADVPGLHVCGHTVDEALESAKLAVKALFRHNRKIEVEVLPASEDSDSFPQVNGPVDKFVVHRAC